MELEFSINRKDYSNFNKYYYFKKSIRKRLIVVLIAAIAMPFITMYGEPFELLVYLKLFLFVFLFFGSIYFGLGYIRIMTSGNIPKSGLSILGDKKLITNEEGISVESELYNANIKWNGILSVEENSNYLYLFVDSVSAIIIPKRYFRDLQHYNEFLTEIQTNIKV